MSVRLLRSASIGQGFLELAARQIDKALQRADEFDDDPGDRIHDVRKRSKRLRALLRLMESDLPAYERIDGAVAAAARTLARMRDQRVLRQTLDALYGWSGRSERLPPSSNEADGQAERAALGEFASGFRAIANGLSSWRTKRMDHRTIARGLAATYRKARKARRKAERTGDPLDFHRWRKHTKYHWYQVKFLEGIAPDILGTEAKAAKELTGILGHHHDLAMLRQALGDDPGALGTPVDIGFVEDAAAARQRELAALAGRVADQIFAEKPKAFARRLAAYWTEAPRDDVPGPAAS